MRSIPIWLRLYSFVWKLLYVLGLPLKLFLGKKVFNSSLAYSFFRCAGYGEQVALFLTAQAEHETGEYELGKGLMRINNWFGMKFPNKRDAFTQKTAALGDENGFMWFSSVIDSLAERINYDVNYSPTSSLHNVRKNYALYVADFSDNGYATDSDYISKVEVQMDGLKSVKGLGLYAFAFYALGFVFAWKYFRK